MPLAIALLAALVLTPISMRLAGPLGVLKVPRERDIHSRPTPELGGWALAAAFMVGALIAVPSSPARSGLLAIGGTAALVFYLDDRFGLPAGVKFGAQAVLALVAVFLFGSTFRVDYFTVPGHALVTLGLFAYPVSVIWILGMTNTVNLLDGVDGLAGGVVAIVAMVLLLAASTKGPPEVELLAAALVGACAGFLAFNWHPARVFMGDAGSHFLGFALALLSVAGVAKVAVAFALVIPAAALAVPILDTALAIVRRRRGGVSIAHADTRHIHHQLLDFGLNQRQTCVVFYCAAGILGSLGLMLFGHRRVLAVAAILLLVPLMTVLDDALRRSPFRVPAPGLRRLLGLH